MKKTRILVLFDTDGEPPAGQDYSKQLASSEEAEFDVARTLIELGHSVCLLGFRHDLVQLVTDIKAEPVDVVFNLAEGFRGVSSLDFSVAAVLDMREGKPTPERILDPGFVIHQGNLKEMTPRMWGAHVHARTK